MFVLKKKEINVIVAKLSCDVYFLFILLAETMDIGTPEALQYDFGTVQAATNEFSEDNKLGQGGFGAVYKVILLINITSLVRSSKTS